jgi:transcriptional regulator with XRE-family HTH domain
MNSCETQSEQLRLKEARKNLGITQQEAANRAGIILRQYQRYESGEHKVSNSPFVIARRVLDALGIDLSEYARDVVSGKEKTMPEELTEAEVKHREQWDAIATMLGVKEKNTLGGVEDCEFSVEQLTKLLELDVILLKHKFNDSPTVETFYEFGKRAVAVGATTAYIGILESKYRKDYRAAIEGIKVTDFPESMNLALDFAQTFHDADEFTANPQLLRAWYD